MFDRVAATLAALGMVGLAGCLLIRNEPVADPALSFALRLLLSLTAATLGATLPGFLQIGWTGSSLAIRAGGALALFVLSFMYTPNLWVDSQTGQPRVIKAGHDINIWVAHQAYLQDFQVDGVLLPHGWDTQPPKELLSRQKDAIAIYPIETSIWGSSFKFMVSSISSANVKVESLYLKMKYYANVPSEKGDGKEHSEMHRMDFIRYIFLLTTTPIR